MSQQLENAGRALKSNIYFDPVEFYKKSIKNYLMEKVNILLEQRKETW